MKSKYCMAPLFDIRIQGKNEFIVMVITYLFLGVYQVFQKVAEMYPLVVCNCPNHNKIFCMTLTKSIIILMHCHKLE